MAKNFIVQFGSGNPALNTGLSPTFTVFNVVPGGATTPPGITEVPTATGLFYFTYEPRASIAFVIDAGVTFSGEARYLAGALDPVDAIDERISELGTSLVALASSLMAFGGSFASGLGSITDSFGTTLTDPTTVFGYLKRNQEFCEGNNIFTKTSGVWDVHSRGNTHILGLTTYPGSSTQIASKTIVDSGSVIRKS